MNQEEEKVRKGEKAGRDKGEKGKGGERDTDGQTYS